VSNALRALGSSALSLQSGNVVQDTLGAFVPGATVHRARRGSGLLSGLTFAAKDLFDVAGVVTGCGNPDWAASHEPAQADAWAIDALLRAGATLVGKTITDEISLGLLGINKFYGTPRNPHAPDRVPGGSSSGSASAVAGGLVDVALGTDSGGSVRIPASFCGLYGLRPTHGRISTEGMMTQAPSFDTVGYFARNATTFGRVGTVLLGERVVDALPDEIIVATDCFALADEPVRRALLPVLDRLRHVVPVSESLLAEGDLRDWSRHQRVLQKSEFHATFRNWIDRVNPRFSIEVAGAFADDGRISAGDMAAGKAFRESAWKRLDGLLDGRRMLCMPTSPILPIGREARLSDMRTAVHRIVDLTGIAGLTGVPQLNLPMAAIGSIPVGLSLVGWRGGDAALVGAACALAGLSIGLTQERP
jgi:amidase